jgi:uncharacterized integral membrane protein
MVTNLKLADPIIQLPTDNIQPNQQEIKIVNSLFQKHGNDIETIVNELKDSIIAGLLFIVLSLPQVDQIIKSFFPSLNESPIILTLVKAVIFIILFYFIKNYALSKK